MAVLNPTGTVVHLFVIFHDFNDMLPNHRTFIRQRTFLVLNNTNEENMTMLTSREHVKYLAHLR
jgi:hypothetical protein